MPKAKKKPNKERTLPGPGREPTLTVELIAQLSELVKFGNYIETAYLSLGIKKPTFYAWMQKGQLRKGTLYAALLDALTRSEAEGEASDVMGIYRAGAGKKAELLKEKDADGNEKVVFDEEGRPIVISPALKPDWKARAWRLERRNPNKWGRSVVQIDPGLLGIVAKPGDDKDHEETVMVDPYSIKAILDKIESEY